MFGLALSETVVLWSGGGKGSGGKTEDNLKVVENFDGEILKETLHVWNVAENFIKRAKICRQQDGGHVEHVN